MSTDEIIQQITETVKNFASQFYQDLAWRAGQMIPGMDGKMLLTPEQYADPLKYMMEPQEWLTMAKYAVGLLPDADPGEIYEICQALAEWMFSIPGESAYEIPAAWYATPVGALWATAFVKVQGDELISIAEAAEMAGVSVQAVSQRIDRGTLKSYVNPLASERQGKRLVKKSDV